MSAAKQPPANYYETLGIARTAKDTEIRRAYRNLLTQHHPDKGGDAAKFHAMQRAYDVLSNEAKRKQYDRDGVVDRTVDEEFLESFGGGSFQDRVKSQEARKEVLSEQITVQSSAEAASHTSGFEAWLRSRGDKGDESVINAETIAERFGVEKSTYDAVPLPLLQVHTVTCGQLGKPKEVLTCGLQPLPRELAWGEVLVSVRFVPINPADLYAVLTGGAAGEEAPPTPFVAGSDCAAVVAKVGPGVKTLVEGDWVIPFKPAMGTLRSLAVWREKDLLKLPTDLMPLEHLAFMRQMCVGYRLLEDFGTLQPGDAVVLNAASSAVGSVVVQLCRMLRLRAVAVLREGPDYDKQAAALKALGATEVLPDVGSLRSELEARRFFAKPKLALDAVGGPSAARLADALEPGCPLVIYGCMSGKAPTWPWQQWVFKGLKVQGFNLRSWMAANKKRIPPMLETLAKLVNADKLRVAYTEYELGSEFGEALEHALEEGRGTKILLKVEDIGLEYSDATGSVAGAGPGVAGAVPAAQASY